MGDSWQGTVAVYNALFLAIMHTRKTYSVQSKKLHWQPGPQDPYLDKPLLLRTPRAAGVWNRCDACIRHKSGAVMQMFAYNVPAESCKCCAYRLRTTRDVTFGPFGMTSFTLNFLQCTLGHCL
jgi:hypothetical protein